jgi:hypothetical protein
MGRKRKVQGVGRQFPKAKHIVFFHHFLIVLLSSLIMRGRELELKLKSEIGLELELGSCLFFSMT